MPAPDDRLPFGPPPVAAGTDQVNPLVSGKVRLRSIGYAPSAVEGFVLENYKRDAYTQTLQTRDNALLVMPATSRLNLVPEIFASQLQRDFGGVVFRGGEVGVALARRQAKDRNGYLEKMRDPSRYVIEPTLRRRISDGANVVIVDDILTSGETLDGLTEALESHGIRADGIVTLGAIQYGAPANPSQVRELSLILSKATGRRWKEIEDDIRLAHRFSRTNLLKKANQEARSEPLSVHQLIAAKAAAFRSPLGGGKAPGSDAGGPRGVPPG